MKFGPCFVKRVLASPQAQSVLEYVILTSLIGIFCLVGIKQFGERLKTRINKMNQNIEKHIHLR